MADCYITSTGSYLPGEPVENKNINQYLGRVLGEGRVQSKILAVNGIQTRHYALDKKQNPTHSIYELATEAVKNCLSQDLNSPRIDYLSAGTTHAPILAPGDHPHVLDRAALEDPPEVDLALALMADAVGGVCDDVCVPVADELAI